MKESTGGILRLDKPVGPTSHDMVARVRRALGTRRVGHTGTLDPFASGLLLMCVGPATRLSEVLTGMPKSYEAEAVLGVQTDTDDTEGTPVMVRAGVESLDEAMLDSVLASFHGQILQRPPPFSAKKIGGEAAYLKARRGEVVDLLPVAVEVYSIQRLSWAPPLLRFKVTCSSGTYVRGIARDVGEVLGVGAHLSALRRTAIGPHGVEGAVSGDHLDDPGALVAAWLPLRMALSHLAAVDVGEEELERLRRGQSIQGDGVPDLKGNPQVALFHHDVLVALAESRDGLLHPRKVLVPC